MKYQELGKSGIEVSKVALGTWGVGGGSVWTDHNMNVGETENLLAACREQGINYIDTAPVYGTGVSEDLLGKALKSCRQDFILQTKCSLNWRGDGGNFHYSRDGYTVNNDTSAAAVRRDVEDSLRRMGTDYIDSIIVHYVCKSWPVEETVGALEDMVKEGLIRTYGLSNSQPDDLHAYQAAGSGVAGGTALVQEFFSILSPFHGRDYFDACSQYGTTFQTYGVLEEGFLTGPEFLNKQFEKTDIRSRIPWVEDQYKAGLTKMYEQWKVLCEKYNCSYSNLAEAWALSQYDNMSLLIGMRSPAKVEDTAKCVDLKLAAEDIKSMEDMVKDIQVEVLDK